MAHLTLLEGGGQQEASRPLHLTQLEADSWELPSGSEKRKGCEATLEMLEERGENVRTQWLANKESHPCGGIKSEVWGPLTALTLPCSSIRLTCTMFSLF